MRYQDRDGLTIYVAPGAYENFTFYKSPDPDKRKGKRMKVKIIPQWYPTKEKAEEALLKYASIKKLKSIRG